MRETNRLATLQPMMDDRDLAPLDIAHELDALGRPVEASEAYEHVIAADRAPLDAYLDLIGLYFEYLDARWWDTLEYFQVDEESGAVVPEDFLRGVAEGLQRTIDRAEEEFGEHPELTFWREYTLFIHYDGEPFMDVAEELFATGQTQVPALYLVTYGSPEVAERYRSAAEALLDEVENTETTRARYLQRALQDALYEPGDVFREDADA